MSRSKKKHPGGGNANSTRQKQFKKQEHKAERHAVKQRLNTAIEADILGQDINVLLPHPKEYGNEWASPRDGKQYWTRWKKPLQQYLKDIVEWMRK